MHVSTALQLDIERPDGNEAAEVYVHWLCLLLSAMLLYVNVCVPWFFASSATVDPAYAADGVLVVVL